MSLSYDVTSLVNITLTDPVDFRFFQRDVTTLLGTIEFSGEHNDIDANHDIEASYDGVNWTTISSNVPANTTFTGQITNVPKGQYTVMVRFVDDTSISQTLFYVSIGEYFPIMGQSNASSKITSTQKCNDPVYKLILFGNDYVFKEFDETVNGWFDSTTGQIDAVSADTSGGPGSIWPILGEMLIQALDCPVCFGPNTLEGTPVEDFLPGVDHYDRATLYGSFLHRTMNGIGGCRNVLFWGGESNMGESTSTVDMENYISQLAAAIFGDTGSKLMICKLQHLNEGATPSIVQNAINDAIDYEWNNDGNVLVGPDLRKWDTDDNYHITSVTKARAIAAQWLSAILQANFYNNIVSGNGITKLIGIGGGLIG